jgi:hypothetical protein
MARVKGKVRAKARVRVRGKDKVRVRDKGKAKVKDLARAAILASKAPAARATGTVRVALTVPAAPVQELASSPGFPNASAPPFSSRNPKSILRNTAPSWSNT